MNATNAATGSGGSLHKSRLAHASWPPATDKDGLFAPYPPPLNLRDVVEMLASVMRCTPELEVVWQGMVGEDGAHDSRVAALEARRLELVALEQHNERLRGELRTIESTGGGDSAEHTAMREQLTEMQAKGQDMGGVIARHSRLLEEIVMQAGGMHGELAGEVTARGDAALMLERCCTAAEGLLPVL